MLIDGELVEADSGPAVREHQPGHRGGARRGRRRVGRPRCSVPSPPRGGPSTRPTGRRTARCASAASSSCRRRSRPSARSCARSSIAEVGTPAMRHVRGAARRAARGRPALPGEDDRRVRVGARPPERQAFGMSSRRAVWKEPMGVVGAIVPWNYPFEVTINKIGQILATGNTTVLKPAPDTPWNATPPRPARRREDRHPGRCVQRGDVVRPPRRRGAHAVAAWST